MNIKKIKQKRRGKRKSKKKFVKSIRFLGVNSAGLRPKLSTFKKVLKELKPAVFFVEETKYKEAGKLKIGNYEIFELVRESQDGGGGLALGCLKELQPAWVRQGDDQVEALSVDIFLKNIKIRCCVAYGCQETDLAERKEAFWTYLDKEVSLADESESGFVLHFDGNLWAGPDIIPGDPRPQNRNGKLFQLFLERHPHLTVVNTMQVCEGLITRSRLRSGKLETSVLDFFVICDRILPFVTRMVIDEGKKHVLTNFEQVRKGGEAIDTDHYTQFMDLELDIESEKPERVEIYNFKKEEGQKRFKQLTSETSAFSDCFRNEDPLCDQVENWHKILKSVCNESFSKIRIKNKNFIPMKKEILNLITERNNLIGQSDNPIRKQKIDAINHKISTMEAEENRNKLLENFKYFSDNPENINLSKMWKLLKKISPKVGRSLPTAKKNHRGRMISGARGLKTLLAKEYKDRLRTRPIRPDLGSMKWRKKNIFKLKMKLAQGKNSPDWTMFDLDNALAKLKNNKSRDYEGFVNEIFKKGVIGSDLKKSFLIMFNKLRKEGMIPSIMNFANITTVPKRGSRLELKNERGIFRVPIVRCILMLLIYGSKYPSIDKKISDCQMGGRKGKGCKNNIFILNAIIHDVLKSKKMKPVLLQFYDYSQMFDSINLEEAISDIYDTGVDDDNLALLYNANKNINMAVKTPHGLSDRQTVKNIVLQGDTWGSMLASVQVDKIGQECMAAGYFYLYKNVLPVGFLGLVDDTVGITEAGYQAQQLNALMNVKTAEKTLQFGASKCKSMLIGKNTDNVINNQLHVDNWIVTYEENESTGEADLKESYNGKIPIEQTEEYTYLGFVISSKGDNMANIRQVRNKSIGVIRKIFDKLSSLNLKQYYFECAMLLMNVMLRGSILYASDMYYNLKEHEMRQIERIEEGYLRKIFKTTKGCPIVQLYLSVGQYPARFEIQKLRLLYLKYILEQNEDSVLRKTLQLQIENPCRGDWGSTCINDLKELDITLSLQEIRTLTKSKFSSILKEQIKRCALIYLNGKQGEKGKEMKYNSLEMSEYLQPTNDELSIEQKREMFSVKNRMIDIPYNFPRKNMHNKCVCGETEDMSHIYNCELLNKNEPNLSYETIFTGNLKQQIEVYKIFKHNLDQRELIKSEIESPCDPDEIRCKSVMDNK